MSCFLDRIARVAARHPWRTMGLWAVILVVVGTLAGNVGGEPVDDFRLPGSEAQAANDLLEESFPTQAGGSATVVFHPDAGTADSPEASALIGATLDDVRGLRHVVDVAEPTVSGDRSVAFVDVRYDRETVELGKAAYEYLDDALAPVRAGGVQAEIGGSLAVWEETQTSNAEQIGLLVAAVVLLFAFGSFVAMLLPIGVALFSLVVGGGLIVILSGVTNVPTSAETLAVMIGLGVGIDYALFIVTRFREQREQGASIDVAAGRAAGTAGVAVLFAGGTVVIAITGLLLSGIWAIGVIGVAAAMVVGVTVLAALTLLPALLGLVGPWIDRFRLPVVGRRRSDPERGLASRWAGIVTRHPVAFTVAGAATLITLALPIADLHLGQNDAGSMPTDTSRRRAYDLLVDGFGAGFNDPLLFVATVPDATAHGQLNAVATAVADTPGVASVGQPRFSPAGDVAVFNVMPDTTPQSSETTDLVRTLRDEVIPAATDSSTVEVLVTGTTAANIDLAQQMGDRLPLLIAAVLALSFILLLLAFRSVLIPLKAALMNVLSIGAAYGVIVAVFQWGWAKGAIGLTETVPIVSWVPMLMFAILFGLSMDYEVFLLSRIREAYNRTGDTRQSIADGLAATARVITAAAVIMIAVFLAFVAYPDPVVKMVGLGLAVAVAVDATIVRLLLVPALMELMGRANWWVPRWLDRILPTVHLEDEVPEAATTLPNPALPVDPAVPERELVDSRG